MDFFILLFVFCFFRRQRVDTGNISIFSLSTHKSKCARMADWLNCRLRDGENPVPGEQSYMSTVPARQNFFDTHSQWLPLTWTIWTNWESSDSYWSKCCRRRVSCRPSCLGNSSFISILAALICLSVSHSPLFNISVIKIWGQPNQHITYEEKNNCS